MADSKFFGGEKAPAGKEFRDSGSLGRGLKDLRKDVNVAFLAREGSLGAISSMVVKADGVDIALDAATIFSDIALYTGTGIANLTCTLTATQIVAALNAKYAEIGLARTAAEGDTISLKVVNHSDATLTLDAGTLGTGVVFFPGTGVLPAGNISVLTKTSAVMHIMVTAVDTPAVMIIVAL